MKGGNSHGKKASVADRHDASTDEQASLLSEGGEDGHDGSIENPPQSREEELIINSDWSGIQMCSAKVSRAETEQGSSPDPVEGRPILNL